MVFTPKMSKTVHVLSRYLHWLPFPLILAAFAPKTSERGGVIILAASLFLTSLVVSLLPPPRLAHHNLFSGPSGLGAAANHLTQSGALSAAAAFV